jgi:hypothetical protein
VRGGIGRTCLSKAEPDARRDWIAGITRGPDETPRPEPWSECPRKAWATSVESMRWTRTAADKGDTAAMGIVAVHYAGGHGVARDC